MKKMRECEWYVAVIFYPVGKREGEEEDKGSYYWKAGVQDDSFLFIRGVSCGDEAEAKANWEFFARINHLDNWEWVK